MITEKYDELNRISRKILQNNFGEDKSIITACYVLEELGVPYLIFVQEDGELCTMWCIEEEMVGLQPLPYVKEYGERIW